MEHDPYAAARFLDVVDGAIHVLVCTPEEFRAQFAATTTTSDLQTLKHRTGETFYALLQLPEWLERYPVRILEYDGIPRKLFSCFTAPRRRILVAEVDADGYIVPTLNSCISISNHEREYARAGYRILMPRLLPCEIEAEPPLATPLHMLQGLCYARVYVSRDGFVHYRCCDRLSLWLSDR
jgi:hypothetical protein